MKFDLIVPSRDIKDADLSAAHAVAKTMPNDSFKGTMMAEQKEMQAHVATYNSVMGMLKWGAVACFLIGMGVVFLIAG